MNNKIIIITIVGIIVMMWIGEGEGSSCSPSCGTHGSCNDNTKKCECDTGYGGDDCSLRLNDLEDGQSDSTTASSREFVYYFTPYQAGSLNYVYSIQQLNTGDCDVYVKSGSMPSRTIYDWKDTSVNSEFSVTATPTTGATMYVGVYGYRTCSYLLSLSVTFIRGTCENSCSSNGQCIANNCICHPFYYSSDCSKHVEEITEDDPTYEGEAEKEEWVYYVVHPAQSLEAASPYKPFSITLSPSSLSNTYIYIKKEDYPDLSTFDYRNGVLDVNEDGETLNTITIAIGDPTSNMYYIGVYSQNSNTVSYSISASFTGIEICNEQCSAHGACVEGINSCTCNDGYSGSYCQTLDGEMEDGVEYGGYVKNNAWNYYHLVPASGSQSTIFVTLQQVEEEEGANDTGSMDCNMYLQSDTLPSKTSYAYRDLSTESVVQIPIINPMSHTWYIGVYGFHYCNYVISQSILSQCPTGCEEHGQCVSGVCQCNNGYTGPSCATQLEVMERAPEMYVSEVGAGKWHYYVFTLPDQSSIISVTASLRELNSSGFISLYIKSGSKPSLDDFDLKDTNESSDFHSVSLLVTPSQNRQIYIGVFGESFIPYSQTKDYKVGVYSPNIVFP